MPAPVRAPASPVPPQARLLPPAPPPPPRPSAAVLVRASQIAKIVVRPRVVRPSQAAKREPNLA